MTTIRVTANSITTSVTSPTVAANTATVLLDVITSGYGEEVLPNDALFKRLSDTFTTSEILNVSQGFGQIVTELLTTSELTTLVQDMNRGTGEFTSATDILTRVFTANRSILELVPVSDSPSLGMSKPLPLETQTVSDVSFLAPNKVVPELVTTSESKFFGIAPGFLETPTTSETLTLLSSFTRAYTESVPVTELFQPVVQFIRNISDTVVATELSLIGQSIADTEGSSAITSDSTFLGISPTFSDTPSLSEVIALLSSFNRSLSDTAISSDSPSLSVSIVASTDTASTADSSVRLIGSTRTDSATTIDGGTMNNQSYYLEDYVIPGYVGTNYSF